MSIEELKGKTLTRVAREPHEEEYSNSEQIVFWTETGEKYRMYHECDCCEDVYIESIVGDLNDLVGHPILVAEERVDEIETEDGPLRHTFYALATIKGHVDIRWVGTSNGYYSVAVDFGRVEVEA